MMFLFWICGVISQCQTSLLSNYSCLLTRDTIDFSHKINIKAKIYPVSLESSFYVDFFFFPTEKSLKEKSGRVLKY